MGWPTLASSLPNVVLTGFTPTNGGKSDPAAERKYENQYFDQSSPAHIGGGRQRPRQHAVDNAFLLEPERGNDAPIRIDDRRDAGIGGAHDRQTLLDGAEFRLVKMLIGPGAGAEPGIIGQVQKPPGPVFGSVTASGKMIS